MFNLHRGKQQPADPLNASPKGRLGSRQEQEAEQRMKLDQLRKIIQTYLTVKQLENSLYMTCVKKCVNIEDDLLNDKETSCLKDCHQKISLYMKIAKEVYKDEKGGASEVYATIQKASDPSSSKRKNM
jgi:hypothetical protein